MVGWFLGSRAFAAWAGGVAAVLGFAVACGAVAFTGGGGEVGGDWEEGWGFAVGFRGREEEVF